MSGGNGFGKSKSNLRQLHNLVIGVKDHDGRELVDKSVVTQDYELYIQQSTLEDARTSVAGKFLLQILASVDYAGKQHRPVMFVGRKQQFGGFKLFVTIPMETKKHPGPPPGLQTKGVQRTK